MYLKNFLFQALLPVLMSYFPSSISIKTLEHFVQVIRSGDFRQFDYGTENIVKYNSSLPPEYEIWKISLPVYMFIGNQDFIAPAEVGFCYEFKN